MDNQAQPDPALLRQFSDRQIEAEFLRRLQAPLDLLLEELERDPELQRAMQTVDALADDVQSSS
jgi:hypothetical protein